jgi:hypothetical protein
MPKIVDCHEHLSQIIFGTSMSDLDILQHEFLELHHKRFISYKKEAAKMFRNVLKTKKLNTVRDYGKIEMYYSLNFPLRAVQGGIDEGLKIARDYNRSITGSGWFHPHIMKLGQKHTDWVKQEIRRYEFAKRVDYPFMFFLYSLEREGKFPERHYFDICEGIVFDLYKNRRS